METIIKKEDEQEAGVIISSMERVLARHSKPGSITNNEENEQAGNLLKEIRIKVKLLNDKRLSMTRPIDDAKKKIMDFFSAPIDKLKLADSTISQAMSCFYKEQECIRQAEEAKIKAKADAEAKKLAERAEKAEAAGKEEKAEELRQKAQDVIATTPIVESRVGKVAGVAMREYWYFQVLDETKIPREFLCIDENKLQKYVDAMKGMAKIEGVKFWSEAKPVRTR